MKSLVDFAVSSAKKDGRKAHCKECGRRLTKEWVKNNPEKKKAADKRWHIANFTKVQARLRKYAEENREKVLQRSREWYQQHRESQLLKWRTEYLANPEKFRERGRKAYATNPEKWKKRAKKWREANPEKAAAKWRDWRRANLERAREISLNWYKANRKKRRAYINKRLATDPIFKMHAALSRRFHHFLGRQKKSESVRDLIGCDYEYLWLHLELSFQPGMRRENYGKVWHVDHFKPCSEFDPRIKEHRLECWHFSNLQPMPPVENITKGKKWSMRQEADYHRRYEAGEAAYAEYLARSKNRLNMVR